MVIKLFFDADALIAGSASSSGAAFVLLQLCELGILKGYTCQQVVEECRRNIVKKLPQAKKIFEQIISCSLQIDKTPAQDYINQFTDYAHKKDLPILASAIKTKVNYLVTFNTKHFFPSPELEIVVANPGEILQNIRIQISKLSSK